MARVRQINKRLLSWASILDGETRAQAELTSRMRFIHPHVALMPDAHLGKGATVGSVIPTLRAVIPAAVGVDIGCGMMAARLSLSANEIDEASLRKVFNQISRDVPVGYDQHKDRDMREHAAKRFNKRLTRILEKHPGIQKR